MRIEKDMFIQVKTVNSNGEDGSFGTCLYRIEEVGMTIKTSSGEVLANDGVRAVMMGGSGPAAREGYSVVESEKSILANIEKGIASVVSKERAKTIKERYSLCVQGDLSIPRPATGVIEL